MNGHKRRKTSGFSIRYHGNWCGPGWSDGQYIDSVCGFAPAIDEFDQTCKEHDCAYFKHGPHAEADHLFFERNVGRGIKRTLAGVAVLAQGNKKMAPVRKKKPTLTVRTDFPLIEGGQVTPQSLMDTSSAVGSLDLKNKSMGGAEVESVLGGSFSKMPLSDSIYRKFASRPSGHTEHCEYQGTCSGGDIVWFGHATISYQDMLNHSARAISKYIFAKMGVTFDNWNDVVDPSLNNISFNMQYQSNSVASAIGDSISGITTGNTYLDFSILLRGRLIAIYSAHPDAYLTTLYVYKDLAPAQVPLATLRLNGVKLHFFSSSNLAVQNISQAQSGTEEIEDSDNITSAALTGKVYQFRGNFARKVGRNRDPLDITASSHVTKADGFANPTDFAAYSEPVHSFQFYGCKKHRAIQLGPGQIKTDQFSSFVSTTLNQLWKNYTQRVAENYTHNYGHFHLFCLEKKVAIAGGRAISVALNCDIQMATYLEERLNYVVNPVTGHFNVST